MLRPRRRADASRSPRRWSRAQIDAISETRTVTFTGGDSLVGTLPYMSPEQWGADAVDHQSDIWAIGIMFWRALTGVHPAGTMAPDKLRDAAARSRHAAAEHRRRAIRRSRASSSRSSIAASRSGRRERYQNATELLADLQAFLAPRPSAHARGRLPVSRARRVRRGRREVLLRPLERDPHRARRSSRRGRCSR